MDALDNHTNINEFEKKFATEHFIDGNYYNT